MTQKVHPAQVRAAYKDVLRYAAAALAFLDAGDLLNAYKQAEAAHNAAFDAKSLIADGGAYDAEANRPDAVSRDWLADWEAGKAR